VKKRRTSDARIASCMVRERSRSPQRHLLVALERLGDVGQRRALVLDGFDQEPRLVVLDPLLHRREDLVGVEVRRRDPEGLVGRSEHRVETRLLQRAVLVGALHAGEALQQFVRLLDAVPAEVVDHATRRRA